MWDWFRQARDKAIPLSGPILQRKALEFASQLDIADLETVVLPTPNFSLKDFWNGFGKLSDSLIKLILS
jgi:hypothetical protein